MREIKIQSRGTLYHVCRQDFMSAYNNNGQNTELALTQVSMLRGVEVGVLKTTLRQLIEDLKNKKNPC